MGKYRGQGGWIHDDTVGERPKRVPNVDPVHHGKKRKKNKMSTSAALGCISALAVTVVLVLAVVLGVFHKLLTWLWS